MPKRKSKGSFGRSITRSVSQQKFPKSSGTLKYPAVESADTSTSNDGELVILKKKPRKLTMSMSNRVRRSFKSEETIIRHKEVPAPVEECTYLCPPKHKYNKIQGVIETTECEDDAYFTWLNNVICVDTKESFAVSQLRMEIFLFFFRQDIPMSDIILSKVGSTTDWKMQERKLRYHIVSFLSIPLDSTRSPYWWCSTSSFTENIIPNEEEMNICHFVHTKPAIMHIPHSYINVRSKKLLAESVVNAEDAVFSLLSNSRPSSKRYKYIGWIISFVIKEKLCRRNAAVLLCKLVHQDVIEGLLDRLWSTGCAHVILEMVRNGSVEIHNLVCLNQLKMDHVVGKGAVGQVHLAEFKKENVAVKMTTSLNSSFVECDFRLEIGIMNLIQHPNILRAIGGYCHDPTYFFLSPFKARGNLRMVLDSEILTWKRKIRIAQQISSGMEELHSKLILHRDIKSENILVNYNWAVSVADFGNCRFFSKIDKSPKENLIGTSQWMAPEMISGTYDEKADVYSFSIVLYEIFTQSFPYSDMKSYQVFTHVAEGGRPTYDKNQIPPHFEKLLVRCWSENPKKRPSFKKINAILSSWIHSADAKIIPATQFLVPDILPSTPTQTGYFEKPSSNAKGFMKD